MISHAAPEQTLVSSSKTGYLFLILFFIGGLLLPLGFAPFHRPIAIFLSLLFFYTGLSLKNKSLPPFICGLFFGLGYFGLGISWVFISVRDYGHLNSFLSGFITFLFLFYLALYPAFMASVFSWLKQRRDTQHATIKNPVLFAALWIIFEYLRSNFLSGFPWLLIGTAQFDSALRSYLPIFGTYGAGFISCLLPAFFYHFLSGKRKQRLIHLALILLLLLPTLLFKDKTWTTLNTQKISVGIVQANLSMRDKWDEQLFWKLLQVYEQAIDTLLGNQLIVLPESAIPLPTTFLREFFANLQEKAKKANSAILLGIPQPTSINEHDYYNALISLGRARGSYLKQHLVPFGEYIPPMFQVMMSWLDIPDANLQPGGHKQPLIKVAKHPIATLICYELAYPHLLRHQLPEAQWIVSISDDGWFGHSLAMYQQQQIAQVLSLQTGRYQVVSNNDGLSAIIDEKGQIINSLPAFSSGILKGSLIPSTGLTPWVRWGDKPLLIFLLTIIFASFFRKNPQN